MTESLHAWRKLARQHATTRQNAMASIGDTLVFFRSEVRDINLARVARRLLRRRRSTGAGIVTRVNSRLLNASAGMGLAAVVAREQRDAGPESLLRILSSTEGPHRIGVGTLPPALRNYLAWLFGYLTAMCTSILIFMHPQAIPWLIVTAAVCFATRPDLDSFSAWTRRCAPLVAAQKTMLLDKLRATVAPYFMSLRPPVLSDYGLFSIVTLIDHADYVYVYAGFLSRWCLLGWYNMADDYNFDKIYLVTKS